MLQPNGYRGALLALSVFGTMLGCGDGAICPSEIVVVFQSPATGGSLSSVDDSDAAQAGIQKDVVVRSNLKKGDDFVLTVTDSNNAVEQIMGVADSDGDVTFSNVTFPTGEVALEVTGTSDEGCGSGSDEIALSVITDAACALTITNGPIENDFYAPIPVLNSSNDDDGSLPNFQASIAVASEPGFQVELFVLDVGADNEASIGTMTTDASGLASFTTTLAQGKQAVRATCSKSSVHEASATSTLQVDTVVPTCSLTAPAEGVTVTPDYDTDGSADGIQMTWTAEVDDGDENDTEGEDAAFFRDALEFSALNIDANGDSSSELAEFTAPGTYPLSFVTQDHAANTCTAGFDVKVIMDGCSITVDAPTLVVTADSDGLDVNGLQTDVTVTVASECEGQDVFVDCGQGESSATAPVGGVTIVADVTLATNAAAEGSQVCNARVVNPDLFETTASRVIEWDTQAPGVNLVLVSPAGLSCGDSIARNEANDANSNLADGFQIGVAVSAPLADTRSVTVNNSNGLATATAPGGGVSVNVDLLAGDNDVRAVVSDSVGNQASSVVCNILLEDITVDFDDPAGTGTLGIAAGTINGTGDLELPLCVTVSESTVAVTISVDGNDFATSFDGSSFCTDSNVALSNGTHALAAIATSTVDARQGSTTQSVDVDLSPPSTVGNLQFASSDHQTLDLTWDMAASASSYLVRYGTTVFSTDPNVFVTQGQEWLGDQSGQTTQVFPVNAGTQYFVGVVAVDAVGNMADTAISAGITPAYDDTDAFSPILVDFDPATQRGPNFGIRHVQGNFNGDAYDDVAIAAPFNSFPFGAVYIYFGSAAGISVNGVNASSPDVTIQAAGTLGFGNSLARLNWSGGASDGLAIGSPFPSGAVFVFHGATLAGATGTLSESDRDIEIAIEGGAADWFTGGRLGWSMSSGQLDAAGTPDDLIIGVPRGGVNGGAPSPANTGDGGVVIIYGGNIPDGQDTITLSSTPANANTQGLTALIFENPQDGVDGSTFANEIAYLGDTRVGNGVGDIAIAYYADQVADASDNVVYIVRGRTLLTPGIGFTSFVAGTDLKIVNPTADLSNEFGLSLGSISDQNGDGFRDIVIGARTDNETNDGTSNNEGRLWIVSGSEAGDGSGTLTLTDTSDYILKIVSNDPTNRRLGAGIANNALVASSDINGDGLEDLVTAAGFGELFVWFGGTIGTGDIQGDTADYIIARPAAFGNSLATGFPAMIPATWLGDINNDGLADIGRGDWSAGPDSKGLFDILWDE